VTIGHVLEKTWTLLRYRIQRGAAERFSDGLGSGGGVDGGGRNRGHGVCLANLDSPIVISTFLWLIAQASPSMRRLGIERAASFGNHIAVFRFGPQRRHAFAIVG
jgi:hypothetical protein